MSLVFYGMCVHAMCVCVCEYNTGDNNNIKQTNEETKQLFTTYVNMEKGLPFLS